MTADPNDLPLTSDQENVEKALQESQERLKRVIAGAPLILWVMDPRGIVTFSDGKGLASIGLVPGEVVGQSIFDLNASRPDIQEYMRRALQGEALTSILEDQGEFFETHYTPQFDQHGSLTRVIAVSEVITERKKAEEALRESEERNRSIVDNSPDGILLTSPDGQILSANPAACRIFEMSEAEICRLGRSGVVDVSDPRAMAFLQERQRTGRARGELTLIRKGGIRFPAEVTSAVFSDRNGNPRTSMIIRDITEQKKAEAALRASEEQYQSIFKTTRDGIFILDLDGCLADFNPEACHMMGYTEEEFRLLQPIQCLHSESQYLFAEFLGEMRAGRQFRGRGRALRKDGTIFPFEVFGTPITYAHRPHGLAIMRDISEQVQAYQLLEKRVSERTRELSALLEVSRNVASTLELQPLLALILSQLKTVVDYTGAAIITLEEGEFIVQDYVGPIAHDQAIKTRLPSNLPTVFSQVAAQREPVVIADLWADAFNTPGALSEAVRELFQHAHSWIGVPLVVRDCLIGVLSIEHVKPGFYTQQDARLGLAFADQAAVAISNAELYAQAQALAALEERQKLARELHDSVSQALYGIALGARTARALLDRDPSRAAEPMDYCITLAEAGLAEMRSLIFELRPESLEREGLVAALAKQADSLRARLNIQVTTALCEEPAVSFEIKQVFYRIGQEAMQNIFKHAQASRVHLMLETAEGKLCMSIRDDGGGFNVQSEFAGHLGLMSMRERAQKIGGVFTVRSAPGQGTVIRVEVGHLPPLSEMEEVT